MAFFYMLTNLILCSVFVAFSVILLYWIWFYIALNYKQKPTQNPQKHLQSVSVIIACKNEKVNISSIVAQILNQDYPNFELIVIDDFSTDGSRQILETYSDSKLKILSAKDNISGKKSALTQAIHAAQYELILLTDADCVITSSGWIQSMAASIHASSNYEIAIGFSPMLKGHNLINLFSRYETILTAIQYGTYARSGMPYMAVGRNLMYKKELFMRLDGFQSHKNIASGDDDLLIQQGANRMNTVVNLEPESFVYTTSKTRLIDFLYQKSRHISTATHYKMVHKMLLFTFAFSQMVFYIGICIGICNEVFNENFVLAILIVKWLFQIVLLKKWFEKLQSQELLLLIPILDLLMVAYYFILPVFKTIFTKKKW